jgi:hypothetical protein
MRGVYMGHSTELVKTGGGIKKRIFSLFAYMHSVIGISLNPPSFLYFYIWISNGSSERLINRWGIFQVFM